MASWQPTGFELQDIGALLGGDDRPHSSGAAQIFGGGCIANESFNPSISVSGDFSQTNNCPATLQGLNPEGQSGIINVTFTPTSTGLKEGILSAGSRGAKPELTGNGVTTPTPTTPPTPGPARPPLTLDLDAGKQKLKKKLKFSATTNHDSTLAARGCVKQKVVELVAGEKKKIIAKLRQSKRAQLEESSPKPARPRPRSRSRPRMSSAARPSTRSR